MSVWLSVWAILWHGLFAQSIPFPGPGMPAALASYSGPGDVVTGAKAWWGLRAYNASQATALVKAVQLCTAGDITCTDIHVTAAGGLNASDITTSGCSAIDTCTAKILYDQSGTLACSGSVVCDASQSTEALRPTFTNSAVGGLPCLKFTGSSSQTLASIGLSAGTVQPFTVSMVVERTGNTSAYQDVYAYTSVVQVGFDTTPNGLLAYAGNLGTKGSVNDNAFHAVQSILNGASSTIYADGSSSSVDSGTAAPSGNTIGGNSGSSNYLTGFVCEVGSWPTGTSFSGGQLSSMNSNQHSYWGF